MIPWAATPPLALSADEAATYRLLAHSLLDETLREYDDYAAAGHRVSDVSWKLVKSQDGISVFKERRVSKHEVLVPTLLTTDGRHESVRSTMSTPYMLVTGTMAGTIDDVLYGAFVDSTASHRLRGFYIKDKSSDFRVLAHIDAPTMDAPFTFCGLAWTAMGDAGVPLVRRRDMLSLVASGTAQSPATGERVGYYIIHSIAHARVPPLAELKITRAESSFVYLFRQCNGNSERVETFQKVFFCPHGDVPTSGVMVAIVRTLLTPMYLVEAACAKKLRSMMKHASVSTTITSSPSSTSSMNRRPRLRSEDAMDSDRCGVDCERKRKRSNSFSNSMTSFSASLDLLRRPQDKVGACVVCKTPVCGACKIVKKIVVEATAGEEDPITCKSLGFCLVCINKCKTTSGVVFARQELVEKKNASGDRSDHERRPVRTYSTYSATSSSSSASTSNYSVRSPQYEDQRRSPTPAVPQQSSAGGGVYLLHPDDSRSLGLTSSKRREEERRAIEGIAQRGL